MGKRRGVLPSSSASMLAILVFSLALHCVAGEKAVPSPDGPADNGYKLKFIDTKAHPLAVCNDGSPGAYYVHDGTAPAFVIHQQGGWWCWDDYSCQVRWDITRCHWGA